MNKYQLYYLLAKLGLSIFGKNIRNVFTNDIEKRHVKELETTAHKYHEVVQENRENAQASYKLAGEVCNCNKEIVALNRELSDLSIQYFRLHDRQAILLSNLKKVLPGRVDEV